VCNVFSWFPVKRVSPYGTSWTQAFAWEILRWNLWLALAPLIARWEFRFRLHPQAAAAAGMLLFPSLHSILLVVIYFGATSTRLAVILRYRSYIILTDFLAGIIVCGLIIGFVYSRRASDLESQLAYAELQALQMQLQPHFLFNTLHAIGALQLDQPETAQRMLVRLSDFLRLTLESSGVQEISLEREIDFLARYLEIERIRFPTRLAVDIHVDPAVRDARVPNLILQPLVENAIRHGIAARAAPGRVEVQAARRDGQLWLQVRDTGPGLRGSLKNANSEGVGLSNTRARLERLYGRAARLCLESPQSGGTQVTIEIPLRLEPRR
jgi:signal transduction histidine kinase